jgi:hypothetical protein
MHEMGLYAISSINSQITSNKTLLSNGERAQGLASRFLRVALGKL